MGGAKQTIPEKLTLSAAAVIKAKITFQPSGSVTDNITVGSELTDTTEVSVPSGTKSFVITYYCEQVQDATDGAYSLGEEFQVGPATVYMTIKKTTAGERGG